MRGGECEQGDILNHRRVAQVLSGVATTNALGREMLRLCRGDEDAASCGGEAEGEIKVFAAHPEIRAMKTCVLENITSHEQANALRPVELRYFRAE